MTIHLRLEMPNLRYCFVFQKYKIIFFSIILLMLSRLIQALQGAPRRLGQITFRPVAHRRLTTQNNKTPTVQYNNHDLYKQGIIEHLMTDTRQVQKSLQQLHRFKDFKMSMNYNDHTHCDLSMDIQMFYNHLLKSSELYEIKLSDNCKILSEYETILKYRQSHLNISNIKKKISEYISKFEEKFVEENVVRNTSECLGQLATLLLNHKDSEIDLFNLYHRIEKNQRLLLSLRKRDCLLLASFGELYSTDNETIMHVLKSHQEIVKDLDKLDSDMLNRISLLEQNCKQLIKVIKHYDTACV